MSAASDPTMTPAKDAPTPAPVPVREERYRLAVVVVSAALLFLIAPLLLPFADRRSFLDAARGETAVQLIMAAIVFWPLFVGALGVTRGLRRRAPSTLLFAIPAVVHLLAALGTAALMLFVLSEKSRARESPGPWGALVLSTLAIYVLARGFRRTGWDRFAQLVSGVWLVFTAATALFASEARDLVAAPESGAFVLLLALGAGAPAVIWILSPRRR